MSWFHHIALPALDVEMSAHFFLTIFSDLGLREVRRDHDEKGLRSIWLADTSETPILMLERATSQAISGRQRPPCLVLQTTPNDREALVHRLSRMHVAIEHQSQYTIYFRDPSGNALGASHYPLPNKSLA